MAQETSVRGIAVFLLLEDGLHAINLDREAGHDLKVLEFIKSLHPGEPLSVDPDCLEVQLRQIIAEEISPS